MIHYERGQLPITRTSNEKLIAEKKNLDRRLDSMKEEEYKRVLANLQAQNIKLKEELQNLNEKVSHLIERKKIEKKQANKLVESQIEQLKHQLEEQYRVLDSYKKQLNKQAKERLDEKLVVRYMEHQNAQADIAAEMMALQKQKKTLQAVIEQNNITISQYTGSIEYDSAKYEQVTTENKQMKKKLQISKKQIGTKEKQSQEIMDKLMSLKLEHRKRLSLQQSVEVITQLPSKKTDIVLLNNLQKEVESLRKKKTEIEDAMAKEKQEMDLKRARIEKAVREHLQEQKKLVRERTQAVNKLNMLTNTEKKLEAVNAQPELLFESRSTQTQQEQPTFSFRRDWAGKISKSTWDDSTMFKGNKNVKITKMDVYFYPEYIVCLRCHYDVSGTVLKTHLNIDQNQLKKCNSKVLQSTNDSYVQSIKLGIRQNTIVYIQLKFNSGEIHFVSTLTDNVVHYLLDIQPDERPMGMFQCVQYVGKEKYVLQAVGCEILQG